MRNFVTCFLSLLAISPPSSHAFVPPAIKNVVETSSSSLLAVSPTATEDFKQLLETIRQNHDARTPNIIPATTEPGDASPLLAYIKENLPGLVHVVKNDRFGETFVNNMDLSGFATLKWNLQHMEPPAKMFHLDEISSVLSSSANEFSASALELKGLFASGRFTASDITQALNLKETSGWYMATFMLFLGVAGALQDDTPNPATAALEEQVKLLQTTSATVDQLRGEDVRVGDDVATLRSDLKKVQKKLKVSATNEKDLREALRKTQEQLEKETGDLRLELQKCFVVERDLRNRLKEAEKALANEKKKLKKARKSASLELASFQKKVIRLENEKKEMENEMNMLKKDLLSLRDQVDFADDPLNRPRKAKQVADDGVVPTPVMARDLAPPKQISEVTGGASLTKKAIPRKRRRKPREVVEVAAASLPATVESSEMLTDLTNSFFVDISGPIKSVNKPPLKTKTRATVATAPKKVSTTRKSAVKKKAGTKRTSTRRGAKDWSTLSVSTLKRKTIKDLTSYLESKGETTVDTNGKTLRKDALVGIVLGN